MIRFTIKNKKIKFTIKNFVKSICLIAVVSTIGFMNGQHKKNTNVSVSTESTTESIPAYRLMNNQDGTCTFEKGTIPTLKHMNITTFWLSNKTEEWEKNVHPAPRRQYVITLKGNIKFKVSDGSTFIIKPGVILLAEDLKGKGHSWDMGKSKEWVRMYVPIAENAEDFFIPDSK